MLCAVFTLSYQGALPRKTRHRANFKVERVKMQGKMFKCSTAHVRQLDVEQSLTGVGRVLGTSWGFWRVLRGPGGPREDLGESLGDPWEGLEGPWRVLADPRGGAWRSLGALGEDLGGPRRVVEDTAGGLGAVPEGS